MTASTSKFYFHFECDPSGTKSPSLVFKFALYMPWHCSFRTRFKRYWHEIDLYYWASGWRIEKDNINQYYAFWKKISEDSKHENVLFKIHIMASKLFEKIYPLHLTRCFRGKLKEVVPLVRHSKGLLMPEDCGRNMPRK